MPTALVLIIATAVGMNAHPTNDAVPRRDLSLVGANCPLAKPNAL
jgi:hypothetical protein